MTTDTDTDYILVLYLLLVLVVNTNSKRAWCAHFTEEVEVFYRYVGA